MTDLSDALGATLVAVADALRAAREPWWIIGSAAVALHGARPVEVRDVDLLLARGDAARLLARLGLPLAAGRADERFRSDLFGRWSGAQLPVDMMAGFHVRAADGWREVIPQGRHRVEMAGRALWVPPAPELAAMLRLFGRRKDLDRAALLDGFG